LKKEGVEPLDQTSCAVYIHCPSAYIVDLQSYFEIYESLGVVRTLDSRNSLVGIITTPTMLPEVEQVLEGLQTVIPWTRASLPSEELRSKIFNAGRTIEEQKA
jgi:hypothetical protein